MEVRTVGAAVLVLVLLLGTAQLAFTDVGESQGTNFTPAVVLDSMAAGPDTHVTDLAAAGNGEGAAAAWIVRDGGAWSVHVARLTIEDGDVSVGETRQLAAGPSRVESVSVAAGAGSVAVAYEIATENDVAVHVFPQGARHVVANDALRTLETGVAMTDSGPVVTYQEYWNGAYLPAVSTVDDGGNRAFVGSETTGNGVPTVASTGNRIGVTWFDVANRSAVFSPGTVRGGELRMDEPVALGPARIAGSFGSQGVIGMNSDGGPTGVRAVWTDVGRVKTATWSETGGVGRTRELGVGERPGVATGESGWLAAWLVETRASGLDVRFVRGSNENTSAGVVSQLQTDAIHPNPVFAPDPGVVWTERGGRSRVLASGYRPESTTGPTTRILLRPQRFLFVALAAAVIGAVVTPLMPWNFVSFFVAFYATSATVRNRVERFAARSGNGETDGADLERVRARVDSVPQWVWVALFVAVDSALLVGILPAGVSATSIQFSNPVGVSGLAAAGTAAMMLVRDWESTWAPMIIFAYFQTAALWITGLPTIL